MTATEPADTERPLIAREAAADKYLGECLWPSDRDIFRAGWDAALEWARKREQELLLEP